MGVGAPARGRALQENKELAPAKRAGTPQDLRAGGPLPAAGAVRQYTTAVQGPDAKAEAAQTKGPCGSCGRGSAQRLETNKVIVTSVLLGEPCLCLAKDATGVDRT
ncbi:unnamed protein product [Rangifer tarandus platyrhynchus]|uniref:Uncharacterized protein n=1 Tax=Rangifer tarandus platyrhynchus TaxID=3082113 RepID=A0AC60A3J9_RANTA